MKPFNRIAFLLACALLAGGAAYAQGVGASGSIKGSVSDPTGAVITNATVTATESEKGIDHTAKTGSDGQYLLTDLPPTIYVITTKASGFQTQIIKNVIVTVGQTVTLDFHMKVSTVAAQVEVSEQPPVIDTEKSQQADTLTEEYIRDLPINRRDYLTFTLLVPGVSDSTRLASDQDYRVKQTPQSGLSFYGSNGRGNTVTVDGGEVNDDAGGVRLTMSQDAVQEFQVNRSNYSAELGSASGASMNIVTKSGTNQVHGSLYGFFRNDAFDARNPFATSQALAPGQAFNPLAPDSTGKNIADSLSRQQYGGTIGFPIQKDKTFLFASFEGLHQDSQNAVPILTNTNIFRPTAAQNTIIAGLAAQGATPVNCFNGQPMIPASFCAGALQSALTVSQSTGLTPGQTALNNFIVNQFESNGGLFAYNTRTYFASGRLDHTFNSSNQAHLLYHFAHDLEQNPDVTSLTGFTRGSSIHDYDNTLQGAWFHLFSPRTQNEVRLQWNFNSFNVIPNVPGEVGLDIPGFANLGTQIFLPSLTIMRRYEAADNFTFIRGHHSMKAGFYELYRGNHSESHTFFPGRFDFGPLPGFLISPQLATTTINGLQSVSFGLPQFYEQGFGNPIYSYPRPFTALYWQDSWSLLSNFTVNYGVRYELDSQYGKLGTDKDNVAPRVSFAWDPFKDHKTVIRGGYGIFYSPIYGQIADVVQTLGNINGTRPIANVLVPLTGNPLNPAQNSALIFQSLFAAGLVQCTKPAPGNFACVTPASLAALPIPLTISNTGPLPPLTVIFSGQPNYQNPISQQMEFGIEREIAPGWSLGASAIYVHTQHLPVAIDINALPAPTSSVTLANGHVATFRNWGGPGCAGALILNCFANPLILQADQYSSAGAAIYEGMILELTKRMSHHITMMANYTYSKAYDNVTDFNSDFGPVDNTNLNGDRSLSTFDQRHKMVIATVLDSPWTGGQGSGVFSHIFAGFQLSPIFRWNSPHPFNLLAGADVNGDRHSTNDRPIGADRNTGIGPSYYSWDTRLSREFKVTEKARLQVMFEAFNLFNRTNFASVNNIVGPNFGLTPGFLTFAVRGNRNLGPSQPLGFTSAFPRRQLQFGARLSF